MMSSNDDGLYTGNVGGVIQGGSAVDCTAGVAINGAAEDTRVSNVHVRDCVNGLHANTYDAVHGWYVRGTLFDGCSARSCTGAGVAVDDGAVGTRVQNLDAAANQIMIDTTSDLVIDGAKNTGTGSTGTVRLNAGSYSVTANKVTGVGVQFMVATGTTLHLSFSDFAGPASGQHVNGAGTWDINHTKITGDSGSNALYGAAGATVRIGAGCVFTGYVGTINRADATAHFNRGTFVMTEATPQAIAFRGIVAEDAYRHIGGDKVKVTLRTVGGTPGPFGVVITDGVGFTVTGTAGDTSTYDYEIN